MFMLRWKGKYPPDFVLQFFWFFFVKGWQSFCCNDLSFHCSSVQIVQYLAFSSVPFFVAVFILYKAFHLSHLFHSLFSFFLFLIILSLFHLYFYLSISVSLSLSFSHYLTFSFVIFFFSFTHYLSTNLSLSNLSLKFNVSVQLVAKNDDKKVQPFFGIRIIDDNTMSWI